MSLRTTDALSIGANAFSGQTLLDLTFETEHARLAGTERGDRVGEQIGAHHIARNSAAESVARAHHVVRIRGPVVRQRCTVFRDDDVGRRQGYVVGAA